MMSSRIFVNLNNKRGKPKMVTGLIGALVTIVFLSTFSCDLNNDKTQLDPFFEELQEKLGATQSIEFQSSSLDSTGATLEVLIPKIDSCYESLVNNQKCEAFLDSMLGTCNDEHKKIYLGVAFHAYLREENIVSPKVFNLYHSILDFQWVNEAEQIRKENQRIAQQNFELISLGDTIHILLPVDNEHGRKYTFFYQGYPYSLDYSTASDSLRIEGVLINKYAEELSNSSADPSSLIFFVKILSLNDDNVEITSGRKYKVGEEFDFVLQDYGRPITFRTKDVR